MIGRSWRSHAPHVATQCGPRGAARACGMGCSGDGRLASRCVGAWVDPVEQAHNPPIADTLDKLL
ncbi:MAG: hypothetical protein HC893_00210 [Chloroflexaceae bacterium]|nr:hypothetical protein [Chloroflexaceae bacterium]